MPELAGFMDTAAGTDVDPTDVTIQAILRRKDGRSS